MTAEQLISELAKVAPADAAEWMELRTPQIAALSSEDNARVYSEWRKLARISKS